MQKGQTSDRPGLLYYVVVRKNKFGRTIYRCLRSNSALEAFHHHIRRASDSCAKHAGPRVQHSRIKKIGFRWNVRALCKAKMIPPIGHYDLHLRDRLCDVARGTPLVAMHVLRGWRRVDQTIKPTVPRGIVEGLLDASLLDKERRQGPSKVPHSKLSAQRWAEDTWGHAAPVDFSKRGDIQTALKNTAAMVQGQAKTSNADLARVRAATGLLPTRAALDSLAAKLAQRQQLDATLEQQGHAQLQAQLQAPAASWQAEAVAALPVPTQQLGVPGPLPTTFGGGSAGGYSVGVVTGVFGPDRGGGSDDDMGGGGDDYYGGGTNGDDARGGVSYKERERKRKAGKRANPASRAEENIRQRWWRAKRKAVKDGDEPLTLEEFKAEAAEGNEAEEEREREAPTVAAKAASGSSSKGKRSRK